jgi:outer membrane PBP1 activator LpoA protein
LKPHTLKLIFILSALASVVMLSSCDSQPVKDEITDDFITASKPVTEHQFSLTEEALAMVQRAEDADTSTEEHRFRMKAAYLYIEADKLESARQQLEILERIRSREEQPDEIQNTDLLLLSAQLAIAEKNSLLASQTINEITPVTREQQIRYYGLKADLDYLYGRYYFVVDRRVQLSAYLVEKKDIQKNNTKIWAALSSMPNALLYSQQSSNVLINGWLDLARVMRAGQQNVSTLENDLLDWGTRHPAHPANDTFLTELIDNYQYDISTKKHIAIILPMQGNLANISDTIKNGILSAYYNDKNNTIKPVLKFYDSSSDELTFPQLYQQALDDGATNIIGPLDKDIINELTQQLSLDVPTLTLNYADNTYSYTENLYQFGLSPEDEARQAAELAINQDKMKAAVFYPDSEWGKRLKAAFTEHYEFLGGEVLTTADYDTNTNDYTRPIRALFNLDQSDIRRRKVENILGEKLLYEARRRQDIDMIFLAATHRSARSIMPAFKFHRAGKLSIYSTSHVYTGKIDTDLDRDLNGLIFCDLPWILQNDSPLGKVFTDNWPQQQTLTRLFAFGIDAYHLTYNLDYLKNKDYAVYSGETGNIRLNEQNRITRKLLWAKFNRGRPVYFEPEITPLPVNQSSLAERQHTAQN